MTAYLWNIGFRFGTRFGISNWIGCGLNILWGTARSPFGMKCTSESDAHPSPHTLLQHTSRKSVEQLWWGFISLYLITLTPTTKSYCIKKENNNNLKSYKNQSLSRWGETENTANLKRPHSKRYLLSRADSWLNISYMFITDMGSVVWKWKTSMTWFTSDSIHT